MSKRKMIILAAIILLLVVFGIVFRPDEEVEGEREVFLYFSDQEAMYLEPETRVVSEEDILYNTVNELITGPQETSLLKTIPEGVVVKEIILEGNTAEINFNNALLEEHWGGSTGERITIYSIVNTMTQFEEIVEVKILIEGHEIETLGHMDLRQPLTPSRDLIQ